jgi:hypothetical protein
MRGHSELFTPAHPYSGDSSAHVRVCLQIGHGVVTRMRKRKRGLKEVLVCIGTKLRGVLFIGTHLLKRKRGLREVLVCICAK